MPELRVELNSGEEGEEEGEEGEGDTESTGRVQSEFIDLFFSFLT